MSGRYFRPLASCLNRHSSTLIVDLPGFGSSSRPRTVPTLEAQASVVAELLEQLGIAEAVLIGHSLGCQIALKVAVGNSRVIGAVLIGPTADTQGRTVRQQLGRLLLDTLHEPLAYNAYALTDYLRSSYRCYLRTLGYMLSDRPEDVIRAVECPIVFVRGAGDPIAPARWITELADRGAGTLVFEVAGAPHGAHLTHAGEVAAICEKLL
jgi:pimeloyl-ACP methyl ester carboxylesterase